METYYVVKRGHQPGIYKTWLECKKAVDGFKNPIFKKFGSFDEANTFFKSETSLSSFPSNKSSTTKINITSNNTAISSEDMQKIKDMAKHIKSSPYAEDLNYNVQYLLDIANAPLTPENLDIITKVIIDVEIFLKENFDDFDAIAELGTSQANFS